VVASAEGLADLVERGGGEAAAQVHRDHARQGDVGGAALARHVGQAQVVGLGDAAGAPRSAAR